MTLADLVQHVQHLSPAELDQLQREIERIRAEQRTPVQPVIDDDPHPLAGFIGCIHDEEPVYGRMTPLDEEIYGRDIR
jgi:hypothetical protein